MNRIKGILITALLAGSLAQGQRLEVEIGSEFRLGAGVSPYTLLAYPCRLIRNPLLDLWVIPSLAFYPQALERGYLNAQFLLDTPEWTGGLEAQLRFDGAAIGRIFVRYTFGSNR